MTAVQIVTEFDARRDEWIVTVHDGRSREPRVIRRRYFHGMLLVLGDEWGKLQPEPMTA